MNGQVRTASGLTVLLSLWLILSPFVLSFAGDFGMWHTLAVGVVALMLAWARYNNPLSASALSWFIAPLGVWLIGSLFLFGMAAVPNVFWNYLLVGVGYILFGAWGAVAGPTRPSAMYP